MPSSRLVGWAMRTSSLIGRARSCFSGRDALDVLVGSRTGGLTARLRRHRLRLNCGPDPALAGFGTHHHWRCIVSIPRWRAALVGSALVVLTISGIGLASAATPERVSSGAVAGPDIELRHLRPFRHLVHGTVTFDHPDRGLITIQLDGGSISAVDSDSLAIAEAGGAAVTVAVNDETRVRLDGQRASVGELATGQIVRVVSRVGDGGTATARWILARSGG
jgi:hypothetical protein